LAAAFKRSRDWIPRVIKTDKNPAYGEAIAELKSEGVIPPEREHRQAKYLNNRLESDHGKLKRLIPVQAGLRSRPFSCGNPCRFGELCGNAGPGVCRTCWWSGS
jgi:hypothetical protein